MTVNEIATLLATTADTVRYYTRLGLVTPGKSDNGYKFYSNSDQSRLRFILSARQLGFSVKDIEQILQEADHGKTACPLVRKLIKARLDETEKQFQEMLQLRKRMKSALKQWEVMADKAPTSHMVCHLIENVDNTGSGEA
ncbi:MerR family transcriptional regulator [Alteromonas sp. CYL-A6]|uniref:MerR family transcriptional regulator n=1 Tax=Alteromonas nitratireducens TaxID=3390813 RepID=UPI0034BAB3C5